MDKAVLVHNADSASCADVTLYVRLSGASTTQSNDVIWWPRCGAALDVSLLLASVFGQNESGMGYCWIVISMYVGISAAKGLKNRSLMLCAGFGMMLMLMLRCLRWCVEWSALYYFEVVWMMQY